RKLPASPFTHRVREFVVKVREEQERLPGAPLFSHEEKRDLRRQEKDCRQRACSRRFRQHVDPFAEGAVADLIVILDEADEGGRRQLSARLAAMLAATIGRGLALIDEAGGQGLAEPCYGMFG